MAASGRPTDAGVAIRRVEALDDLRDVGTLFDLLWQRPTPAIPLELLRALTHIGNYAAGAYDAGHLTGALVGFVGWHESAPALHSHILGVLPEAQGRGIGEALKLDQRAWARERGLSMVVWTFDPLVQRNARFNLSRLGATVVAYLPDFYGPMADQFNADAPTDRLLVAWPAEPGPGPEPVPEGAASILTVNQYGDPVIGPVEGPLLSVATPADIVALRRADPEAAQTWSEALRATLAAALAAGYRVAGLDAAGAYVLRHPDTPPPGS